VHRCTLGRGYALINAAIANPADRLWWQARLPEIVADDFEQAVNIRDSLAELALLHAAATARGGVVDLNAAQVFAAEIVKASEATNTLLRAQGMFDGESMQELDCDSSARLMSDGTLEWNSLDDVFRLAALAASQPVTIAWGLVELRLLRR